MRKQSELECYHSATEVNLPPPAAGHRAAHAGITIDNGANTITAVNKLSRP